MTEVTLGGGTVYAKAVNCIKIRMYGFSKGSCTSGEKGF